MKEKLTYFFQREQVEPSVLTVIEQQESEDEWKHRLTKLPDKIRVVVTLRYMNDVSLADIAQILHIPVGTVKSRLNRGLKLMKVILDELEQENEGKIPQEQANNQESLRGKDGAEHEEEKERNRKPLSAVGQ